MTMPSGAGQPDTTLTRDLLYAARYYLVRPRTWMVLASVAVVTGLVFNWNWLVAAGLAPILLSTLPCLIMCGFGVCMMCRTAKEQSASVRGSSAAPTPSSLTIDRLAPGANMVPSVPAVAQSTKAAVPEINELPADHPSCCHSPDEAKTQTINPQPNERKVPHA